MMIALLLVAALVTADAPPPARVQPQPKLQQTARLILVDAEWHELVVVDAQGRPRLARWCTPWDIAAAWLAGLPRR